MNDAYGKFKVPVEIVKKCPFCGGVPYENCTYNENINASFTMLKCSLCGAQGKIICTPGFHDHYDDQLQEAEKAACLAWMQRRE